MSLLKLDLLAIEVGSSRVKVGYFPAVGACASEKSAGNLPIAAPRLPEPREVFRVEHRPSEDQWLAEVAASLDDLNLPSETACLVAAVHGVAADRLTAGVLRDRGFAKLVTLSREQIPIAVSLKEPSRVGIDRLLNACAANRVRRAGTAAIVVDVGTAMTVNFITADGVFQGGAIAAGPITALRALNSATASLPLLGPEALAAAPPPVGKSTEEAMASGAYWSAVGAARQLIERMSNDLPGEPDVFLTGGAAAGVAPHIGLGERPARYLPNLVLSGIRLAAEGVSWT
jgi:type III pantothenate kinase